MIKWTIFFTLLCGLEVNAIYLSLLNELDITNPVIVERSSDIKDKKMFDFMKDVMKLNQTICLTTKIRNGTFRDSPGLIFNPDDHNIARFYGLKDHAIQKPWIIVGKPIKKYSRIDEKLFVLENGTLSEYFELKSIRKNNVLGGFIHNEFKWNSYMPRSLFERRGNFDNITLVAVTDAWATINILPNNFEKVAPVSKIVPNTYEVNSAYCKNTAY